MSRKEFVKICVECGKEAEPDMVEHARKYNQAVLCRRCDRELSKDLIDSRRR